MNFLNVMALEKYNLTIYEVPTDTKYFDWKIIK